MNRILLCAVLGAALTAQASAHVRVQPAQAVRGTTIDLTFRCPNERPNAGTREVVIQFPPLATVTVIPTPGWRARATMRHLAVPISGPHGPVRDVVDTIAWTGAIGPGQRVEFHVRAGPLIGDGDTLTFKALQTYSNGEIVRWIETAAPGEADVPRPAPQIQLTAAAMPAIQHLRGTIVAIDAHKGTFRVHHEPFASMPMEMTMDVEPRDRRILKTLHVGERIRATVDTSTYPWPGTDIRLAAPRR